MFDKLKIETISSQDSKSINVINVINVIDMNKVQRLFRKEVGASAPKRFTSF